jgi:hypothetical protein
MCAIRYLSNSNNEAKVQIEKRVNVSILPVPSMAGNDFPVAQQHLATLPTRLAMMRWTRGGDIPHPPAPPREMWRRAAWYGGLQNGFQSWLKDGGFHGADLDTLDLDMPAEPRGTQAASSSSDKQVTAINTADGSRALHK